MKGKRSWKMINIYYSFLILTILLFFSLLLLFVVYFVINFSTKTKDERFLFEYQTLYVNRITNETSFGFVSIPQHLEPYEFIFRENEDGSLFLISNHGEEEYLCKGACYCEEKHSTERRSVGAISKLAFSYLVVAVSSYTAIQVAKKYFNDECKTRMEDVCEDMDRVVSEVDCEGYNLLENFDELLDDYDVELSMETIKGRYICKGYCIPNFEGEEDITQYFQSIEISEKEDNFETVVKSFETVVNLQHNCEKINLGSYWHFDNPEEHIRDTIIEEAKGHKLSPSQLATKFFAIATLNDYCRESSSANKILKGKSPKDDSKNICNTPFCSGYVVRKGLLYHHEHTICKKVL